jgi:hypothetical protein
MTNAGSLRIVREAQSGDISATGLGGVTTEVQMNGQASWWPGSTPVPVQLPPPKGS